MRSGGGGFFFLENLGPTKFIHADLPSKPTYVPIRNRHKHKIIRVRAMNLYKGSGSIAPHIPKPCARWV